MFRQDVVVTAGCGVRRIARYQHATQAGRRITYDHSSSNLYVIAVYLVAMNAIRGSRINGSNCIEQLNRIPAWKIEHIVMKSFNNAWPHVSPDAEDIEEVTACSAEPDREHGERRRQQRFEAVQHVVASYRGGNTVCDLVELSQQGARLRIVSGAVPTIGSEISIALLNGARIIGTVKWLGRSEIGVALSASIGDVETLLMFEDLGERFYSAALRLQRTSRGV